LQLKTGQQHYDLPEKEAGIGVNGTNVYGILRAPRGDATEAIVLSASWKTTEGNVDIGGVSLLMSLAGYFKRTPCCPMNYSNQYQAGHSGRKTLSFYWSQSLLRGHLCGSKRIILVYLDSLLLFP
jgi:Gaa1-like, GPI transamidase component